jgi:hypothetical protein
VVSADHHDVDGMLPAGRQVRSPGLEDVAVNIHRLEDGAAAVHLVNYRYDADRDEVVGLSDVPLQVRLPASLTQAAFLTHTGKYAEPEVSLLDGGVEVRLPELPLYSVLVLHDGSRSQSDAGRETRTMP